nr:MAG TPA: hypothetical protein [Caudoviricetes sp.]DAY11863.1 MAG TPA: hypothetical protein [Caudoviricetes sp.]
MLIFILNRRIKRKREKRHRKILIISRLLVPVAFLI